ncbi:MAG: hypothetical protein ACYTG0_11770 [Planctomycetota bacterium]|jgi:hypothetical protein
MRNGGVIQAMEENVMSSTSGVAAAAVALGSQPALLAARRIAAFDNMSYFGLLALAGIGTAILAVVVWCCAVPRVGRAFARMFSVLAIGAGVGVLVWGILAACLGEPVRSPFGLTSLISDPSEAIGWGAGFLAAGIVALVLSFLRGCENRTYDD